MFNGLADLLFPPTCVNCGRVGSFLCSICWQDEVEVLGTPFAVDGLDGVVSYARHSGAIRQALHALKYEGVTQLADPLAGQLAQAIQWTVDSIIPVPLHYSRLRERGYNQANLLAQALSLHMNCPLLADTLIRNRATPSQVGLTAAERQANVEGAFSVIGKTVPNVLLVDDVCTTGATLGAAAQALRAVGVERVYAATVSKA